MVQLLSSGLVGWVSRQMNGRDPEDAEWNEIAGFMLGLDIGGMWVRRAETNMIDWHVKYALLNLKKNMARNGWNNHLPPVIRTGVYP